MTADVYASKHAFETFFREYLRPNIKEDADHYTEEDFVSDLAEDGWPDCEKWLEIWHRIHVNKGTLTPRLREQAMAYHMAGEDWPSEDMRL